MPKVGDRAPDFSLPANDGQTYSLAQFKGLKNVVLVFYPGDGTAKCTAQLCDYRDGWERFQQFDAAILGISTNDMASHRAFAAAHSFPFPLLEDKDKAMCKSYGALMLGGLLGIASRAVFIIDKAGIIRYRHVEFLPIFKRTKEELFAALTTLDRTT